MKLHNLYKIEHLLSVKKVEGDSMGRYVGTIKKLPSGNSFGEIVSHEVSGLTAFFDGAAAKGAKGPGGMIKGARISFEIGGNGRAINIIRSHAEHPNFGRQKRFQSLAHK